jgi:hypothetical protein
MELVIETREPAAQTLSDGRTRWDWHLEMDHQWRATAWESVRSKISRGSLDISFLPIGAVSLTMTVVKGPEVPFARARDLSFRALLLLEKGLGPIKTIEGVSRDKWKWNFMALEGLTVLDEDKTPLMKASQSGELRAVKELIGEERQNLDETSPTGVTALMYAASAGHTEIVELLLNCGADVKAHGSEFSPLQAAIGGGSQTVKQLLDAGASIDAPNIYGETALMIAARLGKSEIVQLLLERGADPSLRERKGLTSLDLASNNGHTRVVDILSRVSKSD